MTKIKSELTYRAVFSPEQENIVDEELEFFLSAKIHYDEDGRVVFNEAFDENESLVERTEYRYDEKGRIVFEMHYFAEDDIEESLERSFDEEGRILEEKMNYPYDSSDVLTFYYNGDGKLTKKVLRDEDGEISEQNLYEYENDNLVRETLLGEEDEVVESIESEYNEKSQLISRHEYRAIDDVPFRYDFEYDNNGNRSVVKRFNEKGQMIERLSFAYDDKGNTTMMRIETATRTVIHNYINDDAGNTIEEVETDLTGHILSSIKRTYMADSVLSRSEVRMNHIGRKAAYVLKFEHEYY